MPVNKQKDKRKTIEKSLTHGSNVRRAYFKMLEREGEKIPEREEKVEKEEEQGQTAHPDRQKLIKKVTKKQRRQQEYEREKKRRQEIQEKLELRNKNKKQMSKVTKTGQPKMGPRINRLLDKLTTD